MNRVDLDEVNKVVADRSDVFYWQTDRKVSPEVAGEIWADRHSYFTDAELIERVNKSLTGNKVVSLVPLDLKAQTSLGNVNSVRVARLESGQEVIIRCHPKGLKNGYFYVEAAAALKATKAGLPSFKTILVHECEGPGDLSFQVCEKLPGETLSRLLERQPQDESYFLSRVGEMMARVHSIHVSGFGPFDNQKVKATQELIGVHATFVSALRAGLSFNLKVLKKENILSAKQAGAIDALFVEENKLLSLSSPVLVHNDFADWNLLVQNGEISGILDWDECVAGDPVSDIACWSTFFPPERLEKFLEGYFHVACRPENFQEKFELLRLRYVISKMTLRVRRYTWEKTDFLKEKIVTGKKHLRESLKYFHIQ